MKKGWLWRAWRTFIQGVISYLIVAVPALFNTDVSVTRQVLIGIGMTACMWGVAAVMNVKDPTTLLESAKEILEQGGGEFDDIPIEEESSTVDEVAFVEESAGEG